MKTLIQSPQIPLSVVTPFYGDYTLLRHCLNSLGQQYAYDFEIIVVNDGNPLPCPEWLRALQNHWRSFKLIELPVNRGRATARNCGLNEARGEWVLFLDSDMYASPELVGAHLNFQRNQGSGWIGQGHIWASFKADYWKVNAQSHFWTDSSQAFFATGNVSVDRKVLLELGGFDEDFIEYGWEDLELGLRLKAQGYRTAKVEQGISLHREYLPSQQNWEENIRKEQARGRGAAQLFAKHPHWETRLMTQLTPVHPLLDACGRLGFTEQQWKKWILKLEQAQPHLALALYRGLLNRYCLQSTHESWQDYKKKQTHRI